MGDRRHGRGGRKRKQPETPRLPTKSAAEDSAKGAKAHGWTVLAHPLFLDQIEKLVSAVDSEPPGEPDSPPSGSAKLLAHLLDLAFENVPRDPGNPAYRQGRTLGSDRKHWFRGKTGNGRYRLFYRFKSSARLIVYAWVNDEESLRTRGSTTDGYAVFNAMLERGHPPDDWDALVAAASKPADVARLQRIESRDAR